MIVRYTSFTPDILGFDTTNKEKPFILTHRVNVYYAHGDVKNEFNIPKGFCSDGVTIKNKIAQFVICCPHQPEFVDAAIIHDYLTDRKITDRRTASEIMKEVLIQRGVPQWKAQVMFLFVELWQKYIRRWK